MTLGDVPRSTILVVDDEPRNRALLRAILRDHDIVEAETAEDALDLLGRIVVDLVLLDVMMPGMDGFEACREIKARHASAEVFLPVLLCTALGDQEHRNQGLEVGADDFISKPYDRRELELRVRAFLRMRHQQDLIVRQLGELRRLDRLKDDLAALIVHDLRNPLAGLDGFLHVMERTADDQDQHEMVSWALLAARNLRDTVEDMLKVRMMEESRLELAIHKLSLRKLAQAAADSMRGEAAARQLSIAVEGEDLEVEADEHLMRRAVENLVANGLRYTRSGTGVTIEIGRVNGCARIDVGDRGPGIPPPLRESLFQKYGSVEVEMGQARRGNGLGLYLVKLTAEAHHGTVAALERPGGGSTFRISLPASA
jgi:two-component system sensor histidine kinase/response regulator